MKKKLKVVHIPFSKRNPYQKLLADGLKKFDIDVYGAPVSHFMNVSFLNLSFINLLFRYWKPDVVHLHWQSSFIIVDGSRFKSVLKSGLFIFQILCLKLLNIKLVWTAHNLLRHETAFRDIETRFTRKLARLSDIIIAHCPSAKNAIQMSLGITNSDKIRIIPHGNFIDIYPNDIDRQKAVDKLGLSKEKLTFLFLGELRYYKGVLDLIDVFRTMETVDMQLVLAGRPHDRIIKDKVLRKIDGAENIHGYLDFIPANDLQLYINAADVLVYPYRNIFTSGGIFLAMSFGKPIIAPRIGCIPDTLNSCSNSLLYDNNKPNGLKDCLMYTLVNKELLEGIGMANKVLAEQYDWRNIGATTSSLYRDIAG